MLARVVNGISTAADVIKLNEKFGVPSEGTKIPYADVSAVIKHPPGEGRWYVITRAWRHQMFRMHNVWVEPFRNEEGDIEPAFIVADPSMRLRRGVVNHNSGMRRLRRVGVLLATTDRGRLDSQGQQAWDHVSQRNAMVQLTDRQARFQPRAPKAIGEAKE